MRRSESCITSNGFMPGFVTPLVLMMVLCLGPGCGTALCAAPSDPEPAHFFGIWSNTRDGFKTIKLGLRSDGRGVLGASIFPLLVRWKVVGQGLHMKATFPAEDSFGQVTEYDLNYDRQRDVLLFKTANGVEILRKVEAAEPDDLEARVEAGLIEEQQRRRQKMTSRLEPIASGEELFSRLPDFFENQTVMPIPPVTVSSPETGWKVSVIPTGHDPGQPAPFRVSILLLKQSVASPSAVFRWSRYRDEVMPKLPILYQMPEPLATGLPQWLETNGFKVARSASLAKSLWAIEQRKELLLVERIDRIEQVATLLRHLLNDIYAARDGAFEVKSWKPAD